ncbi:hypothetical protein [Risungbinella massiliensis]|uniref:hypothetical protein n=1 Tax=Risungbinella massiliensis TaxID=1329796 RepID=UPI0005CBC5E3|nr:hypothetical protein [Risungbinella massiliensis]
MNLYTRYIYSTLVIILVGLVSSFFCYFALPWLEQMIYHSSAQYEAFFYVGAWHHYVNAINSLLLWILFLLMVLPILRRWLSQTGRTQSAERSKFYRQVRVILLPIILILTLGQVGSHVGVEKNGLVESNFFGLWEKKISWSEVQKVELGWRLIGKSEFFTPQYKLELANGESIDLWEMDMTGIQQSLAAANIYPDPTKVKEIQKIHQILVANSTKIETTKCLQPIDLYKLEGTWNKQSEWIKSLYPICK